jgi:hypothetical protein
MLLYLPDLLIKADDVVQKKIHYTLLIPSVFEIHY